MADDDPGRVSLHLRVPPALKQQVRRYARQAGISDNAAACVLLAAAIRAEANGHLPPGERMSR